MSEVRSGSKRNIGEARIVLKLLGRVRYQLLFLVLFAIVLPMASYQIAFSLPSFIKVQAGTIAGSAIALVLGYMGYRKLLILPGITSGGYAIMSMAISFALLTAIFVFLRVEYSRWQLFSSYILSTGGLIFLHLLVERRRYRKFAFIIGGRTKDLPAREGIKWINIAHPDVDLGDVDLIVADLHHDHDTIWEHAIARWVLAGIPVFDTRIALEQITGQVKISHISENTLGSLNPNALLIRLKSLSDLIISTTLLICLVPLMALIAVVIKIDSPGPAIFTQRRIGFRAKPFTVYKFRTMRVSDDVSNVDSIRHLAMTQSNDPRITRFGLFLRKTRLDELPQLYNILRGEMSLIGPRPEAVTLAEWYDSEIPYYHYRHIIRPGLTGWAQVNQGHVTNVEEIRLKLNYDFYYVKNYSLWLDILIVLRTIAIIVTGHGAR